MINSQVVQYFGSFFVVDILNSCNFIETISRIKCINSSDLC